MAPQGYFEDFFGLNASIFQDFKMTANAFRYKNSRMTGAAMSD